MARYTDLAGLSNVDKEALTTAGVTSEEDLSFLQFEDLPDTINVVKRRKLEIIGTYVASGLAIDAVTKIQDIRDSIRSSSKDSRAPTIPDKIYTKPLEYFYGDSINYEEWELRCKHELNQTEFGKYLSSPPASGSSSEKERDKQLYNIILSSVGGNARSVVESSGALCESGHYAWKALGDWYLNEKRQANNENKINDENEIDITASSSADRTKKKTEGDCDLDREKEEILCRLDAPLRNDFRKIGFAIWNRKCMPVIQLSPYDTDSSAVRSEWMRIYNLVARSKKKIDIPRLVYLYGTARNNLSCAYCFVPRKVVLSYDEGVRKGFHNLPDGIKKKIDAGEELTADEKVLQNGLKEQETELLLSKEDRIAWIFQTKDYANLPNTITPRRMVGEEKKKKNGVVQGKGESCVNSKQTDTSVYRGVVARLGQQFRRIKGRRSS